MTVNYILRARADIVLEGDLTYHGMNDTDHPIQNYIDKATYFMKEYGFVSAVIVDSDTGEVLVEMESDCNDFPEPAYYDDSNICGYE